MDALEEANAAYRDAIAAGPSHLRKQADAEIARGRWLRSHRGIPSDVLYDAATGDARDPELVKLEAAVSKCEADVAWCRAVEVACVEAVKGETLDVILERNAASRASIDALRADMPAPGISEVAV